MRETAVTTDLTLQTDLVLQTDHRGVITCVSDELGTFLGLSAAALRGRRVSAIVHPDDRPAAERVQLGPLERQGIRLRLLAAQDTERWTTAYVSRISSGVGRGRQWAFVDSTDQVAFERSLIQIAATWSDVFNVLSEGVIVIDKDGITVAANAAAAAFLGVVVDELPGSLARAQVVVVDENGLPMPRDRLPSTRAFRTGEVQEEDVAYRRRDGSVVWLHARVVPLVQPTTSKADRVVILLDDAIGPTHEQPGRGAVFNAASAALTPRERQVLQELADGKDISAVAKDLDISVHTARGHLKQLMQKLGARSQLQAVVFAARAGLIALPQPPRFEG